MSPTIRASSLRGFPVLLAELGAGPGEYFERFGISADAVAEGDAPVSITAHDAMLDAAAFELNCPNLGLRMATMQDVSVLGPLAIAIQASETLDVALRAASRFLFVHSPALHVTVDDDPLGRPEVVAVTYRKDLLQSPYSSQGIELGIGLMFQIATLLIEDTVGLRSVDFPHGPISPISRYTEFFGTDVRFNQTTPAIRIERRLLGRTLASGNDTIRQVAIDYLASTFPDNPHVRTTTRVERVIAGALASAPGIEDVGRLLVTHPRTLQRQLRAEGTTFREVRDGVRRETVFRLVTGSDDPLDEIAQSVGFTEQSAMTHAVQRWYGVSPRTLRKQNLSR
ncbi:AraC family transcriptional regulator [Gordonia zhaorongruii]|uniref:AraC family transcriptional regulator n=1 Tax=Gordonia zhaorongruii TaxID=2597659 RepID=UPI00104E1470|nr:AraC family transcriptional regulator [Gordonia zhaorongruii]